MPNLGTSCLISAKQIKLALSPSGFDYLHINDWHTGMFSPNNAHIVMVSIGITEIPADFGQGLP